MCMFYKFDALKFIYRNEIDIGTCIIQILINSLRPLGLYME